MKSTKASTLSPHAQPFIPSFAVPDSSGFTCYSSSIPPPQVSNAISQNYYDYGYNGSTTYCFSNGWAPTPVSTYSCTPNTKPALSPCLTLKKLEIATNLCSESSDDISLIDSPCYRGRNWSQFAPHPIGETSASPRVTVEKLGDEQNLSVTDTTIACLIGSDENVKKLSVSVPVPVGSLDSKHNVGSPRDTPTKQKLDPGSSRREVLQKIVEWSDKLLQIPSNAVDLAEGDDIRVKMIIKDLAKLLEKATNGHLSSLASAYRLDNEKGKAHAYSASSSQKSCYEDKEENIEATLYKSLWINAEIEKCELKWKLQHVHMVVHTDTGNSK